MIAGSKPQSARAWVNAVIVVAWMLSFLSAPGASPQSRSDRQIAKASAEELDRAALSALGEGRHQEAERLLKELLRRNPNDARTLYNLAC